MRKVDYMFSFRHDEGSSAAHRSHIWMMLAGCIVMILGLRFLAGSGATWSSLGWLMVLACPLMHIYMMVSMRQDDGECDGAGDSEEDGH